MTGRRTLPSGVEVRRYTRQDGTVSETFTVRYQEPSGLRPRHTFDTLEDAVDFLAKRRSAKRWRPDELRQEQSGRQTLTEFFDEWWTAHGMVELKRIGACGRHTPNRGSGCCRCATSTPAAWFASAAS